jgi:ribosomal protein S6
MKQYELLCVLPGTLTDEEAPAVMNTVKTVVEGHGATDVAVSGKGKSRLTYPMKNIRYGHFYVTTFQAEPFSIDAMNNDLRHQEHILRALINAYDPVARKKHEDRLQTLKQRKEVRPAKDTFPAPVVEKAKEPVNKKKPEPVTTTKAPVDMKGIDEKLDALLEEDLGSV